MGVQPATQLATKDFIDSAHNTVSGNLLILNVVLKFNTKSLAATNRNKGSTNSVMSSPQSKNYSKKHLWFIEKPEQIGVIFSIHIKQNHRGGFSRPLTFGRSSHAPVGLLLRRCWQRTSLLQVGLLCIHAGSLTLRSFDTVWTEAELEGIITHRIHVWCIYLHIP